MKLTGIVTLGTAALCASAIAQINVDGVKGAEWNGVKAYHITHSDSSPTDGTVVSTNNGAGYDAYFRSDANYLYGLVTSTDNDASAPLFANVYLNVDSYRSTAGSNLGFEVTNDDAFIPSTGAKKTPSATDLVYATQNYSMSGHLAVEFAVSWSFLENDPLGMGFAKTRPGDLVTFRTSQAFGYSFSGYDAADPTGYVAAGASGYPDRLGYVYAPQAVPEPTSLAALGLGALGLLRRRVKK